MHFYNDHARFELVERLLQDLLRTARAMPGYADCSETSEPECLRMQADLLDALGTVQCVRQTYIGRKYTPVTKEEGATIIYGVLDPEEG